MLEKAYNQYFTIHRLLVLHLQLLDIIDVSSEMIKKAKIIVLMTTKVGSSIPLMISEASSSVPLLTIEAGS